MMMEDIIFYIEETSQELADDVKAHIADFFDVDNTQIPMLDKEKEWIKANFSVDIQAEIFGKVVVR